MALTTFIQAVPGRPCWEKMRERLESSDIGRNYTLYYHPPGLSMHDNFVRLLRRMSRAPTEYVLRLEDDCSDVNLHITHNLLTWPALQDPAFGVGWGIHTGGSARKYQDSWKDKPIHASLCTLFRTLDLPEIIAHVSESRLPQDIAIGDAVLRMRKRICIHGPSLVENDISVPSVVGSTGHNVVNHTSRGSFDREWRRRI